MGLARIPWHHVMDYADRNHLDDDMRDAFAAVVREMDSEYLADAAEQERRRAAQRAGAK